MTHAFDIFQERRLSVGKIDNNKQMKRESLLDSAFSLFIDNGFNKTSISDIVNNAGVAKGTFYLYFKDKYDIRNHLIAHKASQIFQAAYADLLRHPDIQDFEEQVLFITDNILDQFAANHSLVTLISKHLSWGFFKNSLTFSPFSDAPAIYTIYESLLSHAAYTYRSPELIHAVDVEGKASGIETELVELLAKMKNFPVTYAGGVGSFEDLELLKKLGNNHVDVTIGSALDLFGGKMKFEDVLAVCRR